MKKKFFWVQLDTRNFSFDSFAETREEAVSIMRRTWLKHARQTRATYKWKELQDDLNINMVELGAGYRDKWKLV